MYFFTNLKRAGRYLAGLKHRVFFSISGASINSKHSLFMTLSGLGLLESFLVESSLLYLAFFKTILAALIYSGLLVFLFITLPSKPSFLHDHFTNQQSHFSLFGSFYNRYKPVNRSIYAFATFTKNQEGVRASGYKIQKYVAGKYTHARAPLSRKYTTGIFESKDGTANTRIVN